MPHIDFGPGRIFDANGRLIDVQEVDFGLAPITTPGPSGDVRNPLPTFLEPMELHIAFSDRHRRLLAAITIGWRAKGPIRWVNYVRAIDMVNRRKHRKRAEVF